MNLDTTKVDQIVLSHGHFDHGNGLNHINGGNLICHHGCFVKRYRKTDHTYLGLKNSRDYIENKFNLTTTAEPKQIFKGAYFLGEIPRITDFESQTTPFVLEDGTPDFVMDDSALAFKVNNGIFVVTGCGHSGIVNTLEHAKKVTGVNRIIGVMGGFHLKENNLQTQKTIAFLKDNNAMHVYPSHCTALPALAEFYKVFKTMQIKTGDIINID
ncbi:MAG: MBL fold metallo-hydrolase [Bacteroidetes bacterium HGW-Bacteroidetes-15]|nr:MAG: MBL fold metallo-hydrolase [Bacteroidetes bacterium HGW-Bacteroidetes-15]